jgi:hypothetical protein
MVLRIPGDQGLCAEPGRIPMKPIAIDDIKVMNLGLGRSIYSSAQLEEFACFQESPTRIPGRECGESLQQPGRRTVGLRSVRPDH